MRDFVLLVVSLAGIAALQPPGSPRNILREPMRLLLTVLGSMLAPSSRFPDELVTPMLV